jgi:hypothetical protein
MRCLAALMLVCVVLAEVRADVFPGPHSSRPWQPAPPVQPLQPPRGRLILEGVPNLPASRLRLPVTLLSQSRADAGQDRLRRVPLFTAGSAIALALALAGLWLVRSRGVRGARLAATLAVCGVTAGLVGCWIDKHPTPPGQERPAHPITCETDNSLSGEALLEVSDSASEITLTLDRETLQRFLTAATAPTPTPK